MTRRAWIRLCLLGGAAAAGGWGFYESRRPVLETPLIALPRLNAAFNGLTIGQITDIHAGPLVGKDIIRRGIELIAERNPDLVVLTGDLLSGPAKILWTQYGHTNIRDMDACLAELSRLDPPMGTYAVLGNHDFWAGPEMVRRLQSRLQEVGVHVLRNEAVVFRRGAARLALAGVDDYWEGSYDLKRAVRSVPADAPLILLSHNPDVNEDVEARSLEMDLIISGHTHGGQINLPIIGTPFLPSSFGAKYRQGLVRDGARRTWVSRGLGVFFVPVRLNCPPDVSLITLQSS